MCILHVGAVTAYLALSVLPILTRLRTIKLQLFDCDSSAEPPGMVSHVGDNLHKISSTCSHYIFVWDDIQTIRRMLHASLSISKRGFVQEVSFLQALLHSIDDLSPRVTVRTTTRFTLTCNWQKMLAQLLRKTVPRLDHEGLFEVVNYSTREFVQDHVEINIQVSTDLNATHSIQHTVCPL